MVVSSGTGKVIAKEHCKYLSKMICSLGVAAGSPEEEACERPGSWKSSKRTSPHKLASLSHPYSVCLQRHLCVTAGVCLQRHVCVTAGV